MKIKNTIKYLVLVATLTITAGFAVGCQSQKGQASSQNKQEQDKEENKDVQKDNIETSDRETSSTKDEDGKKSTKKKSDKSKGEDKAITADLKEITYYTYDINTEKLTPHTKLVKEISVGNIMKELSANGVIPKNAQVNTAKVVTVDGIRTLNVDVNDAFVNFDQGSSAESRSLQAFTNSMVKTFKVKQVKLTVEGKNYSGGHIALKDNEYLKFK